MPSTVQPLRAEAWLDVMADRLAAGIVLVDDAGGVRHANSTAAQLLHTATEEALQLLVRDLLGVLDGADRLELEPTDGRSALVIERHEADTPGCLLVLRDAVALQAADTDLLLANRMRGLENLYRAMAHDLKSPLHAVVLNVDLLRELTRGAALDDPLQDRIDGYLDVIQGEISRLGRSIQAMLSQASSGPDARRRVDLRRIQRETVTLLRPLARRKRIRISSAAPRHSVTVLGNRDRIKQALLNLAVNAIEAMGQRGKLEFELSANDAQAVFEVRDDGPGIPLELEQRVFKAHFTTKKTGNGIGLGVARSIGRAHGGELELLRREPRGTTARLRLPLAGKDG